MPSKRHKWVKVRIHVYVCRDCGTGRVNAQDARGWFTTFHRPDGRAIVDTHVPACEPGPRTPRVLAKYASAIACSV